MSQPEKPTTAAKKTGSARPSTRATGSRSTAGRSSGSTASRGTAGTSRAAAGSRGGGTASRGTTTSRGSTASRGAAASRSTAASRSSTTASRSGTTADRSSTASRSSTAGRSGTARRSTRSTATAARTAAAKPAKAAAGNGAAAASPVLAGGAGWRGQGRALRPQPGDRPGKAAARLTPQERRVRGKAARAEVPRESHAEWKPPPDRPDPVALLESQGKTRVPELVPVRYGRMMETPFTYYRGAALPMASDLAHTPASGLIVQACGDAHLSNFGLFGSPERQLVFDVNDFDETLPAPWEWDIKRLAASMEVAARENGFTAKDRRKILLETVAQYRQEMRQLAGLGNLDVWYTQVNIEDLRARFDSELLGRQRKALDKGLAKARTRDSMQELGKLCRIDDGRPRIISDPPVIVPLRDLLGDHPEGPDFESELQSLIAQYRRTLQDDRRVLLEQFEFTDMARKVVGVGSVGTRCWIVLMLGRDDNDPLFLQVKEAEESVLARFAGASRYDHQGQRVVSGQRLMQATSDIFLGWQRVTGLDGQTRDFYVRQLRDWKFSVDIAAMIPRGMRLYGRLCGGTLARAHARSGDEVAIASYLGNSVAFDNAIADFAVAYADQNERDHQEFTAAIASGRLNAERGV